MIVADAGFYSIRKMNQSGFFICLFSLKAFQTNEIIIKKIIKQLGYIQTFAGGTQGTKDGQGTLAQFFGPYCVTMDPIRNIYVGDYCAIRVINSTGLFCWRDGLKYLI